ncbi:TPA: helix-turn-helix transcriptional regulator [Serratia fonticola]
MKKKKLLLICPCNFTKIGMESLVQDSQLSAHVELVTNTDKVKCSGNILSPFPAIDIIVMSLDNINKNILSHFEILQNILSHNYKSSKVVLIGSCEFISLFKSRFNNLLILNGSTKINELEKHLINLITTDTEKNEKAELGYTTLTARQLFILQKLLNGYSLYQIATDLKISYKTVSSHKCTALAKLGIRSLSPLIVPMSESALRKKAQSG